MPPRQTPQHQQEGLIQSLVGSLLLSSGSWCTQDFVCALQGWSLFPPVLSKSCSQTLPAHKIRFTGYSQFLCWIPSLGRLMWVSEPSQQWENFFGIVLHFVGRPSSRYRILLCHDCTPPAVLLQLLVCLQTWGTFFWWVPLSSCPWLFNS